MNRRDFLRTGALATGVALVPALAARADHTEPTGPVSGIGLHVYHYTDAAATMMRVEQKIPADGIQPPDTEARVVEVHADPADRDIVTSTLTAYETLYIAPTLTRDPTYGLPVVNFNNMRMEPKIHVLPEDRPNGAPSEHWQENLRVSRILNYRTGRERSRPLWAVPWRHANVPPHARFTQGFWESAQGAQYLEFIPPGEVLRFEHVVKGDASMRWFEQRLDIMTGSPA